MLSLKGGMAEIPLGALQKLPMPVYPSFREVRQAHAEALGHICQDWEFTPDEDSPSEWCPGCSYLAKKRSEDMLQKSFLEAWLRDAQPQKPQPSPEEHARRMAAFAGYTVTAEMMHLAAPGAIALHCLPAHRGDEIADDVMEGPWSRVFAQAENRLHAQQAILAAVL
jgi:hypothetical protein